MKPHNFVTSRSLTDWIENLGDAMLRRGHGLLDDVRVESFSAWMDVRLLRLESHFLPARRSDVYHNCGRKVD